MSDIFISYKREDQPTARQLADALEREGWNVWWDPNLRAGDRFDDVIEKALNEAKCVIVLWSAGSLQSRYVRDEAAFALERNKLVPIAIENVELPFRFSRVHTPRLLKWNGSREYAEYHRLVEDISGLIGRPVMTGAENVSARTRLRAKSARLSKLPPRSIISIGGLTVLIAIIGWWLLRGKDSVDLPPQPAYTVTSPEKPSMRTEAPPAGSPPVEREVVVAPSKFFRDRLRTGGEGPQMIVIPDGSFRMGNLQGKNDKDEIPIHSVQLNKPFALSRFEVNFDEYDAFAKATGRELPEDRGWGRGRRPVINVSWEDAQAYAKWLSEQTGKRYRLPSEAEWEYATRAGSKTQYWWGDTIGRGQANCDGCGSHWDNKQTAPVGSFKVNPFGLYDTAGNVWEWVEDCWHGNYNDAPVDGRAWEEENGGICGQRVIRGGSWDGGPRDLRSSDRSRTIADNRYLYLGFRLAQDLE